MDILHARQIRKRVVAFLHRRENKLFFFHCFTLFLSLSRWSIDRTNGRREEEREERKKEGTKEERKKEEKKEERKKERAKERKKER